MRDTRLDEGIGQQECMAMSLIRTAEEATVRAEQFLGRYHPFKRLVSVIRDGDSCRLVYDVGVLSQEKMAMAIDVATGDVTEYGPVGE